MDKKAFHDFVMTALKPHGPITSRAMFGGFGIYFDQCMFGLIADGVVYFKVSDETRADFEKYQSVPFMYSGKTKTVSLPYYSLPQQVFQDPVLLQEWIVRSYQVVCKTMINKKKKSSTRVIDLSQL